jgi:DNA primase
MARAVVVSKKDGVVHHPIVNDKRSLLWITDQNTIAQHVWTSPIGQVARFANAVGTLFVSRAPAHLAQEFSKADRRGRIYVDTGRNGYGATFAAAYTVRARRGAPVSAPCTWEEVEHGEVKPVPWTDHECCLSRPAARLPTPSSRCCVLNKMNPPDLLILLFNLLISRARRQSRTG